MTEEVKQEPKWFVAVIDTARNITVASGQLRAKNQAAAVAIGVFYAHDQIAESGMAQKDMDTVVTQLIE